jgi:hydrogenase-1 operon protein HyaF
MMRPGFWENAEGEDVEVTVPAMGFDAEAESGLAGLSGLTAAGAVRALATRDTAELLADCPQTEALLPQLVEALAAQRTDDETRAFDVSSFGDADQELLSQILGEGEVSLIAAYRDGRVAQAQESVMAGLWRVRTADADGTIVADTVEVGSVPEAVWETTRTETRANFPIGAAPDGTMNVLPVLAEVKNRVAAFSPGDKAHVINFTLLPMSETDMAFLKHTLGSGPVQMMSRGYGTCRVVATTVRNVWSVQYFNAMDVPILDSLEICDVPEAARAASEDFEDSAERLKEILEAYFE